MSNHFKPCIIVPIYNQEKYIAATVAAILKNLELFYKSQATLNSQSDNLVAHVIIIDDGSSAACKTVLAQLKQQYPQLILLENIQNAGKGVAVIKGFNYAYEHNFTHALQIDADFQHDISDLPNFLTLAFNHSQALICGQPIYDESVPKGRLYPRYITHFWVCIETLSFAIRDSMCGFRVYPLKLTHALISQNTISPRMGFDIDIIVRLYWMGAEVINYPSKVIYHNDHSSTFRPFRDNFHISCVHTKLFFGMLMRISKLIKRNFLKKHERK